MLSAAVILSVITTVAQTENMTPVVTLTTKLSQWQDASWVANTISSNVDFGGTKWNAYGFVHGEKVVPEIEDGLFFGIKDASYTARIWNVNPLESAITYVSCHIKPTDSQDDIETLTDVTVEYSETSDFDEAKSFSLERSGSGNDYYYNGAINEAETSGYYRVNFTTEKGTVQTSTQFKLILEGVTFYDSSANVTGIEEMGFSQGTEEWYTLQGIKTDRPSKGDGLYIRISNGKASKIRF